MLQRLERPAQSRWTQHLSERKLYSLNPGRITIKWDDQPSSRRAEGENQKKKKENWAPWLGGWVGLGMCSAHSW